MTTTVPTEPVQGDAVNRVVADLRAAREPVYDPTDPIQVSAVEQLRSENTAPVRVECPGLGCRLPAWKLPDGAVYCPDTRRFFPADPDEVPVLPVEYTADPGKLLNLVHVSAEAHGRQWHQPSYEVQVRAFEMALWTVFPAGGGSR